MTYNTKQKELIIDVLIKNKDKQLTADEIYDLLRKEDNPPSLATLYRRLEDLVNNKIIMKYNTSHLGKAFYKYIEPKCLNSNHFHLICLKCSKLIHLDCSLFKTAINHISDEHGFKIDNANLVIYGYCKECEENA